MAFHVAAYMPRAFGEFYQLSTANNCISLLKCNFIHLNGILKYVWLGLEAPEGKCVSMHWRITQNNEFLCLSFWIHIMSLNPNALLSAVGM